MKNFFTSVIILASVLSSLSASSQCNYALGGDGASSSYLNSIVIDGNLSDWTIYLNDPDNNTYDNTSGTDMDAPIADVGRDLTRHTFTEDADFLYFYLQRAGSTSNSTDILYYIDVNNNDMMDYKEPVFHISWSGSNGNATIEVYDYIPALLGSNQMSSNVDGSRLMGTLSKRTNSGSGNANDGCVATGSPDGKAIEIKLPFAKITQLNILNQVINQLTFGQDFKFHVSTINGGVGSVPGLNSINDNFGGCLRAPVAVLPVHLISFQGNMNRNNKVTLNWTVADNETVHSFEIERSVNGRDFTTAGIVFGSQKSGNESYMFYETVNTEKVMYRLRMIDKSHDIDYSRILIFQTKSIATTAIKVYDNPVKDKLTFSYSSNETQVVNVKVYDLTGKILMKQKVNSAEGTNMLSLPLNPTFKAGMYVVEVSNGTDRQTAKFIKQ